MEMKACTNARSRRTHFKNEQKAKNYLSRHLPFFYEIKDSVA